MYVVPDIALSVSADYSAPMTRDFVEHSAWGVTVAVALQGTIWDGGQRLNDRDRAESATRSAQIARQQQWRRRSWNTEPAAGRMSYRSASN